MKAHIAHDWYHGHTSPLFDAAVLRLAPIPGPTHELHLYGWRDRREAALESINAWIPTPLRVRHHWRPWTRTTITRIIEGYGPAGGTHKWPELAFLGAMMFTLATIVYHTALK